MVIHARRRLVFLVLFVLLILLIFLALLGYTLLLVFVIFPLVELAATVVHPSATASLGDVQFPVLVGIESRKQVLRPISQRVLVMEELLHHHQVGIDTGKACLDAAGYLQSVACPEEMLHAIGVINILAGCLEIFHAHVTVGIGSGELADFLVDNHRILFIGVVWVQFEGLHHRGVAPTAGKLPVNLHDGAVYLDAQKIFGLSGDRRCGTECHLALNATYRTMTDEGVAAP